MSSFERLSRTLWERLDNAISARVEGCLAEAQVLLERGHPGAALTVAVTAIELLVRFMLVRPFVGGLSYSRSSVVSF